MSSATQPSTSRSTMGSSILSQGSSTTPLPPPVSDDEAKHYYNDLTDMDAQGNISPKLLVARTGTTPWEMSTKPKEVRPGTGRDCEHPLSNYKQTYWDVFPKIYSLLRSMEVVMTDVSVVRIGFAEEYPTWFDPFDIVLWIGVAPGSLSRSDGVTVAFKCRDVLVEHGVTDVDVEIHEMTSHVWGAYNTGIYALEEESRTGTGGSKKKKKGKKNKA